MTTRKPLVLVAGALREVAAGDTLAPAALATGTPDGSKFLRDDGTWATPEGGSSDPLPTYLSGVL